LARLESGRSDVRLSTIVRYTEALDVDLAFGIRSR
jgi:predicted transcriptional regulator